MSEEEEVVLVNVIIHFLLISNIIVFSFMAINSQYNFCLPKNGKKLM